MLDFPRPPVDTGFGVHDSASAYWEPHGQHYSYAKMLRDHGITWYLMWCYDENKADYAEALIANGIMPIVRMGPAKMPRPQIDMSHIQAYRDAGVVWFMLGNEFNLHQEWDTDNNWKGFDKPVRHVAEWYVRMADQVRSVGGWPLTPPPALGGHWLHRDWFERLMYSFQNIATEQGRTIFDLLYPGGIGIHCRSCGNPLEHGPADYDCSAREWEWFDAIVNRFVGQSLPMANGEWGDEPGWSKRHNPLFDNRQKWEWWHNRNIQQMRWCDPANQGYRYPEQVFANCFWILHDGGTWDDCGLLNNRTFLREMGGSDTTPLWEALPGVITWDRLDDVPEPPEPPEPPVPPEPQPPGEIEFVGLTDVMIDALTVAGPNDPQAPYWKVVKVEIQPTSDNLSAFAVADMQKRYTANFFWSTGGQQEDSKDDPYAPRGARVNAASMPQFNSWGSYGVEIVGNSEALFGFGLYGDPPDLNPEYTAHHPTLVYFRLVEPDEPEPPEPPDPPDPTPDDEVTVFEACAAWGVALTDKRDECGAYARPDEVEKRSAREWNGLVIHHTASNFQGQTPESIAKYHTDPVNGEPPGRGFPSIAYHLLVDFQGNAYFTGPMRWITHHCGDFNSETIGIAVMGDFTQGDPTAAQVDTLRRLILAMHDWLAKYEDIEPRRCYAVPHSYLWPTACPGSLKEKLVWSGEWPKRTL